MTATNTRQQCRFGKYSTAVYRARHDLTALNPASVTNIGGSQAHLNMQPFLTLSVLYRAARHLPIAELRRK